MKNGLEKLNFINLDRYPICRANVEPRASTALQGSIDASCRGSCRALMNNIFHLDSWIDLYGFNT